jgi:hypothetical protein
MPALDYGRYFCANPACDLHVECGDVGVEGGGNWAVIDGHIWVGRGRYGDQVYCDLCGRRRIAQEALHATVTYDDSATA